MKKAFLRTVLLCVLAFATLLSGCDLAGNGGTSTNQNGIVTDENGSSGRQNNATEFTTITDDGTVTTVEIDTDEHGFELETQDGDSYTYRCEDCGETATVTVCYESGTAGCVAVSGSTLTFSGMTEESVYSLSGEFHGNIVIVGNEDYEFELELNGVTLTSACECPLTATSADKVTVSAKKGTENYINDTREAITDEDGISASVWADCDLALQGKGSLYVSSLSNNGIHTKDDLKVKNLFLQVDCKDNALKGNDSVTVESGTLVLIARTGDGIKTTNTDISSKGNQRGTVTISGGDVRIYSACDGIDSAYDVVIDESSATVNLAVYTDKYSKYSEEVTAKSDNILYLRTSSANYTYSLCFTDDNGDSVWCNSGTATSVGNYRYYEIEKPSGYTKFRLYIYTSSQTQGQSENCYYAYKDEITLSDSYDTLAVSFRNSKISLSWTNYTTQSSGMGGMGGFGGGGMGGMSDGNTDKGDYSTKGLKAGNEIQISAGTVTVESYDDSIHANCDSTLENGATPTGNVTVSGGTLILSSGDDGIHADGTLTVSGGTVSVLSSYEGLEGTAVTISGGDVSVVSSDDGINGTGTSGMSIVIAGGNLYVQAGGDGVDSNSRDSYGGMLISGGKAVIISTGRSDSALDTEQGYKYTGGVLVAIGLSGGMSSESTMCASFSNVGTSKSLSLTSGSYLTVTDVVTVKIPSTMNALLVCLGKTSVTTSTSTDGSGTVTWLC